MAGLEFKRIVVFGDSIAWGKGDREQGGWPNRLKISLSAQDPNIEVLDASVPGDTTRDLLKRFGPEAASRGPEVVIFAIGINDSRYYRSRDKAKVPLEEFRTNIMALAEQAKKISRHTAFVGLCPVDESKTKPIYQTNSYYENDLIRVYDAAIESGADSAEVHYLPVFDLIRTQDLPDGLHLAASGHRKLAERIRSYLAKVI